MNTNVEPAGFLLGSGDDTFYGDIEDDYVETGGGNDRIMSEGGDDHIVVQGAGEVLSMPAVAGTLLN